MVLLSVPVLPSSFSNHKALHHIRVSSHNLSFLWWQISVCSLFSVRLMKKSGKFSFILIQPQFGTGSLYLGLLSIPAPPTMAAKLCLVSAVALGWEFSPLPKKQQISTYYKYMILGPRRSPAAPLGVVYFVLFYLQKQQIFA